MRNPLLDPKEGDAQKGLFQAGELFERAIHTFQGPVGMLAEVVITGKVLHLQDVVIYGQGQLSGLLRELLQAKTPLIHAAKAAGFDTLRMTGRRVPGSSSAHPGKALPPNPTYVSGSGLFRRCWSKIPWLNTSSSGFPRLKDVPRAKVVTGGL